jgi:hypothetical protein
MALSLESALIEPLHLAESRFLQVLLREFSLTRHGAGAELRVYFDDRTPAIWHSNAKLDLLNAIPAERRAAWQRKFDDFLLEGKGGPTCDFGNDPDFVFRYASGGTLPVVNYRGRDYFTFFYRDIHPIGWNLANGSCDRRDELLDPFLAVERELREELLIADFVKDTHYVFQGDKGKPVDRPEFAVAMAFWRKKHRERDFSTLHEQVIEVEWIDGPDSLSVAIGKRPNRIKRCFLNINGEDFGIKIDRVAKIKVSDDAVFCDGELEGKQLVNSPVGFFAVESFAEALQKGPPFIPDLFFYDARPFHDGSAIDGIVKGQFIEEIRPARHPEEMAKFEAAEEKFGLCPVTYALTRRYLEMPETPAPPRDQVFISYCHADRAHLDALLLHLRPLVDSGKLSIWEDKQIEPGQQWRPEIRRALDRAGVAVLLVTPAYLGSPFIRDEELAALLKAHADRRLPLYWIPVKASNHETVWLNEVQAMIPPSPTLADMKPEPRNKKWLEISQRIDAAVRRLTSM